MATRAITREQRDWLYSNERLDPWLTKAVEIEEVLDHPFLRMMRKVNPLKNQSDLWMETETFMGLTGNCIWWMRPNAKGEPYQLWILESQKTRPVLGETLDDFIIGYVYYSGRKPVPFDAETVVHHKYPNPMSKAWGLSPIECLSDPVKVNESIYRYERAQFKNMARPDGVLEMEKDATLGRKEFNRMKKEWKKTYGGTSQAGTREEIANGYGVPIPLISPEKSNLSNSVIAYLQYMRDTQDPKNKLYEQKQNEQLLPRYKDGERLFCAFDNCVPDDKELKLKEREMKLKTGYSSINIERVKDGEEEVDWGDRPILPATMLPLGEAPPEKKPPGKPVKTTEELADEIAEALHKRIKE